MLSSHFCGGVARNVVFSLSAQSTYMALMVYQNVRCMGPERAQYCTVVDIFWLTRARPIDDGMKASLT
jgi:hypothetical protein